MLHCRDSHITRITSILNGFFLQTQVQRAKEEKNIRNVGDKVEPASAQARVYKGAVPPVVINALNAYFVKKTPGSLEGTEVLTITPDKNHPQPSGMDTK